MQHKKHTYIRRILLVVLTLTLCLSCFGISVSAEEEPSLTQNSFSRSE